MSYKFFSLDEARQLLPVMRECLQDANDDLFARSQAVYLAKEQYDAAEREIDSQSGSTDICQLRAGRQQFASAIEQLSKAQQIYVDRFNFWVEKITSFGVILRDLKEGLLDFPAEENGFAFFLCWQKDESDINYWHLERDGFIGRKPLATLKEFH